MTLVASILVSLGAGVGSVSRYFSGLWVNRWTKNEFPWGTWIINVLGSFLLGLVFRNFDVVHHTKDLWALLGTGFCGGFTTFSTMSVETVGLFRVNRWLAFAYIGSSVAVGLTAAWMAQHT